MRNPLRILSIEDDPKDSKLIQDLLETEDIVCEVTRVDTQAGLLASLKQGGIDLILADYSLPSFDGITALKLAMKACPEVPFIFVSGTLGEEIAIEARVATEKSVRHMDVRHAAVGYPVHVAAVVFHPRQVAQIAFVWHRHHGDFACVRA